MKKILFILLGATFLAGCGPGTAGGTADLFGGQVIETGQSNVAPSGSEYELLFNKEVTNCHNALTSVMSLNKTGNINTNANMDNNDIIVCDEAMSVINKSIKTIDETLPAKGWEERKENFLSTTNAIIESLNKSKDDKELDTRTLMKLEAGLTALMSTDSGASSML